MERSRSRLLPYQRRVLSLFCAACLAAPMAAPLAAHAEGNPPSGSEPAAVVAPPPLDVAEVVKAPIPPSRSELPGSAFKKLDVAQKGYVTRDDVRELQGFGKAFDAADTRGSGQLDAEQFKRAWESYTGNGT